MSDVPRIPFVDVNGREPEDIPDDALPLGLIRPLPSPLQVAPAQAKLAQPVVNSVADGVRSRTSSIVPLFVGSSAVVIGLALYLPSWWRGVRTAPSTSPALVSPLAPVVSPRIVPQRSPESEEAHGRLGIDTSLKNQEVPISQLHDYLIRVFDDRKLLDGIEKAFYESRHPEEATPEAFAKWRPEPLVTELVHEGQKLLVTYSVIPERGSFRTVFEISFSHPKSFSARPPHRAVFERFWPKDPRAPGESKISFDNQDAMESPLRALSDTFWGKK
ncbi:MAG: hypothetical protein AAB551_01010 [Patescibacteria group bacterium]